MKDYLSILPFIQDAMQARVLQSAFDLGIIDALSDTKANRETVASGESNPSDETDVADEAWLRQLAAAGVSGGCDHRGFEFLLQVLIQSGVVQQQFGRWSLTAGFRKTLPYRDLMQTLLEFAELFVPDFLQRLPRLLMSQEDFAETAELFDLFNYSHCHEITPQNCLQASRWMRLTTMLTRFEAPVCHQHYAFDRHHRLLDVGGNSGEFVLQLCRREPGLQAVVADLPVVCHVGRQHVSASAESARIQFCPVDITRDELPAEFDLITFKSVLHDWPEPYVEDILQKAWDALRPGGRLLIFERQTWDFRHYPLSYGLLPVMLFFRSCRDPQVYICMLQQLGMTTIELQQIPLDLPFLLISATKPDHRI